MMEAQEVEAQAATGSGQQQLKLYSYWMSSCSFRVRIALNLKEFRKLNPMGYVPVLVDGDTVVADSFAIILYLEEKYPQHPLLPPDLQKKAINYQAANIVSSSIQPLQNMTVLKYIEEKVRPVEKLEWVQFHIGKGFLALEELLNNHAGKYATGDEVYMADLFLAPQLYAAITRFQLDMTQFPLLARLHEAYNKIPAFLDALPEKQPDAPS
ncbi:glutathione S-transferase zeta class-like isoform X4 [Malus sylvestris]|uniref:glutathione S-transferase zeta class-like isoform X4 n=1 Tax=Malus sylvestris TaxID=3752 RepID=UPI0010AACE2F|nr:glutathione S-transferase zeta class-like isoform X4 [Malus domestica]XP_050157893.1 glutathione S-transferase zeta class-like isoform X4 [Malus sylvestris]